MQDTHASHPLTKQSKCSKILRIVRKPPVFALCCLLMSQALDHADGRWSAYCHVVSYMLKASFLCILVHMLHFRRKRSKSDSQDVISSLEECFQAGSADGGEVRDAGNAGDAETVKDAEPVGDAGTEGDCAEGFSSTPGEVKSNEPTIYHATKKTNKKMRLVLPVACCCYFLSQGLHSVCGASSSKCQYTSALLLVPGIGVLVYFVLRATFRIAKWHRSRKKTTHGSEHDLDEQHGQALEDTLAQHDQHNDGGLDTYKIAATAPSVQQDGAFEEGKAAATESTLTEVVSASCTASPETSRLSSEPVVPSDNSPLEDTQEEALATISGDSQQEQFMVSTALLDTSCGHDGDLLSS